MQKRGILLAFTTLLTLLTILSISSINASEIDNEIQKITSHAQEYEIGNINYIQLILHLSSSREKMNSLLGATNKEMGGVLKEEQLKQILGEPTEKTKWVWVEKEKREQKMPNDVPAWRKIIFDGNKIQIFLNAWPSVFIKNNQSLVIYRLNADVQFKKPGEQLDLTPRISEIKTLAENYNKNSSHENAETLAEKSVSIEKAFELFMKQGQGKCEDVMKGIFGSENKRKTEKMLAYEIELAEGDNFALIGRLEMCDECEWAWINFNILYEGRGPGFKPGKGNKEMISPEQFKSLSTDDFKREIASIIDEIKTSSKEGDYNKAMSLQGKIQALNDAWNQKSNDVWKDVEKNYEQKRKSMSQQEMEEFNRNYGWIREEQERMQAVNEIVKKNYNERKNFYLTLFSGFEKKEFYYTQEEYEKRLVEEFKEFGKEICNNNQDDNKNEKIDCEDSQCQGKICGQGTAKKMIKEGNETKEIEVSQELFCISNTCQAREEMLQVKKAVCGNHVCDGNETQENCMEDCSSCKKYEPIKCSGIVTFKGKDEKGCPLEPICISQENSSCKINEDCSQPLCGKSECIEGMCKLTKLDECKEAECVEGDEKVKNCVNGDKIIIEKCFESLWKRTGIGCPAETSVTGNQTSPPIVEPAQPTTPTSPAEPILGNQCTAKEDCGNSDDVCSNGKCITLPKAIPIESSSKQSSQPIQSQSKSQPEQSITAQVINTLKTTERAITGFDIEGGEQLPQEPPQPNQPPAEQQPPNQPPQEQSQPKDDRERMENEKRDQENRNREDNERRRLEDEKGQKEDNERRQQDNERRQKEDNERRNNECTDNCNRQCKDNLIMPCVDKCSRESNCKDKSCIDETIKNCESKCTQEKDISSCTNECKDKCTKGERFEIQREENINKEEKGVFMMGGTCRTSGSKTEGFIHFDGWGDPFDKAREYKQKYYEGGNADWCKDELESAIKQRKEFESSFNEEFVRWFFEKYLSNSAEDWEQHVSGIFEIYWKDVDNSRQIAERLSCLEQESPGFIPNLANIKYETEFGKIEFWEEMKTAKMPGMDKEMTLITPYMKIWIFPPKEFIISEMKKAMKNHEFPGSEKDKMERGNEEGPTVEEREMIKQNRGFMKKLTEITKKYNGNINAVVRFIDNGTVAFNLYAQINENDIMKIQPMPPEEVPKEDVRIDIDFPKIYEVIQTTTKDMEGARTESPPWAQQTKPVEKIKEIANGIKIYFKVRSIINSAEITPKESKNDVNTLIKEFFFMMMKQGNKQESESGNQDNKEIDIAEEKGFLDKKETITGEVILR